MLPLFIAFAEIILHKKTGFLVSSVVEAIEAVECIPAIERSAWRSDIERRFSAGRIVDDYIELDE